MAIVRAPRPDGNFYILDKSISEDSSLTWEARAVLIFLLGKPDHWTVSTQALVNQTEGTRKPSGRDSVRAILGELIQAGYAVRRLARAEHGKVAGYDYHVSEQKTPPATDYPGTAKPSPANPPQVSIDPKQGLNTTKVPPPNPPGGELVPAKKVDPNAVAAKKAFDFWCQVMDSPRSVYDDKRKRKLETVVKAHGLETVMLAIKGCSLTGHNMGENDQGTKYNGIDLIFRNADNVERFAATGRRGAKVPGRTAGNRPQAGYNPDEYSDQSRQARMQEAMAGLDDDLFSRPRPGFDDGVIDA